MTTVFARLGFTRDSALWFWTKLLSVAALITSGAVEIPSVATYLGIPLSVTGAHWIQALATVALWIGAQNGNSGLPGENDRSTAKSFSAPRASMILLAVALGAGAMTSTSCAGNNAPSTAPVLPAVKATEVVHALDAARDIAKVVSDAYPATITPADFQKVLAFHTEAVTIIGATPNGWKATVEVALDQLPKNLTPAAAARLQPYLALVKTLVDAFVAAPPDPLLQGAIDASLAIDRALL